MEPASLLLINQELHEFGLFTDSLMQQHVQLLLETQRQPQ